MGILDYLFFGMCGYIAIHFLIAVGKSVYRSLNNK